MSKKIPATQISELIKITDDMVEDINYELSKKISNPKNKRHKENQHDFWSSINHYLKELQTLKNE